MPADTSKTLVSGWGAGMSGLAQMLQQFLMMRMQGQEKDKDRAAKQKELSDNQANEAKRLAMEQQRVDLEASGQRTNNASVLRSSLQGGAIDDPAMIAKLKAAFANTPFEATLNDKSSLPSTQYGQDGSSQQMLGKDYAYLQPTTAESNAEEQRKRDMFLMDMEKSRNDREEKMAPFLQRASDANSEPNIEARMAKQHQFDMQDIVARIKATTEAGKKTDLADDMRALTNGYKALDNITDDAEKATASQLLGAYAKSIKAKYNLSGDVGPTILPGDIDLPKSAGFGAIPKSGGDDISQLPPPPSNGAGLISQFLTGAGKIGNAASDAFTTYLPQYCPPGSPAGATCSKDGKVKQVGAANTRP